MTFSAQTLIFAVTPCPNQVYNRVIGRYRAHSAAGFTLDPLYFQNVFLEPEARTGLSFSCLLDEGKPIKGFSGAVIVRHTENYYWKHIAKRKSRKGLKVLQYAYLNNCQGRRILIHKTHEERAEAL
ncbi:hypothetical protein [Woodsholea maritima]|uniref:hypothetical protein n=1 Tax=Woodsholea maritima TaxID=240237 RepID=UPI00035DE41A|nr:hypothetical protein [Woodsholea maritima]